jgi:septum formation protein
MPIILSSSSERRISLLQEAGIDFIAVNHKLDIEPKFNEFHKQITVENFVQKIASMKAKSIQNDYPENWIIGSDTIVYLNGKVYGKPENRADASCMLKEFSGKVHEVYSGISLINKFQNVYLTGFDKTAVRVKQLSDKEICDYIAVYPPFDKAGSYGIQDKPGIVESYEGSYENVLGLPLRKLLKMLKQCGVVD